MKMGLLLGTGPRKFSVFSSSRLSNFFLCMCDSVRDRVRIFQYMRIMFIQVADIRELHFQSLRWDD